MDKYKTCSSVFLCSSKEVGNYVANSCFQQLRIYRNMYIQRGR